MSTPLRSELENKLFHSSESELIDYLVTKQPLRTKDIVFLKNNIERVILRIRLLGEKYAYKYRFKFVGVMYPWAIHTIYMALCRIDPARFDDSSQDWLIPWRAESQAFSRMVSHYSSFENFYERAGVRGSLLYEAKLKSYLRKHKEHFPDCKWVQDLEVVVKKAASHVSPEEEYIYSRDNGSNFKEHMGSRWMFAPVSKQFERNMKDPARKSAFLAYIDMLGKTIGPSVMKDRFEWYPWPLWTIMSYLNAESLNWKAANGLELLLTRCSSLTSLESALDTSDTAKLKHYVRKHYTRDHLIKLEVAPKLIEEIFSVKRASKEDSTIYRRFLGDLRNNFIPLTEDWPELENYMVLWATDPKKVEEIKEVGRKHTGMLGISGFSRVLGSMLLSGGIKVPFVFFPPSSLIGLDRYITKWFGVGSSVIPPWVLPRLRLYLKRKIQTNPDSMDPVKTAGEDEDIYKKFLRFLEEYRYGGYNFPVPEDTLEILLAGWALNPTKVREIREAGLRNKGSHVSNALFDLMYYHNSHLKIPFVLFNVEGICDLLEGFAEDQDGIDSYIVSRSLPYLRKLIRSGEINIEDYPRLKDRLEVKTASNNSNSEAIYETFLEELGDIVKPSEDPHVLENHMVLWATDPRKVEAIRSAGRHLENAFGVSAILWRFLAGLNGFTKIQVPFVFFPPKKLLDVLEFLYSFEGSGSFPLATRLKRYLMREVRKPGSEITPAELRRVLSIHKSASSDEDENYFERFISSLKFDTVLPFSFTSDLPRLENYMAMWAMNPTKQQEILEAGMRGRQGAYVSSLLWDLLGDSKIKVPFSFFPIDNLCDLVERSLSHLKQENYWSRLKVHIRRMYKNDSSFRDNMGNGDWPGIMETVLKSK